MNTGGDTLCQSAFYRCGVVFDGAHASERALLEAALPS
jgi:hypothetical protein